MTLKLLALAAAAPVGCGMQTSWADELGEDGYAESDGVKIHYVTAGQGPLVVLVHGFPDFWYTWPAQMPELAKHFQVVAIDQRGYNKSGQPTAVEDYAMPKLVADLDAVVKHFKRDKATIVGHDWGGMVAWTYAMTFPDKTERLVILNLPYPKCLQRELANNPEQQKNSKYAPIFRSPTRRRNCWRWPSCGRRLAETRRTTDQELIGKALAFWVKDPEARKKYVEAFKQSSIEGMLNYYKANYPRPPYSYDEKAKLPPVKCHVLMFHGLNDTALLPARSTTPGSIWTRT